MSNLILHYLEMLEEKLQLQREKFKLDHSLTLLNKEKMSESVRNEVEFVKRALTDIADKLGIIS